MKYKYIVLVCFLTFINISICDQIDMVKKIFAPESSKKTEKPDQKSAIDRAIIAASTERKKYKEQIAVYENALSKKTSELMQVKTALKNSTPEEARSLNVMLTELSRTYQDILKIVQELHKAIAVIDESVADLNNYLNDMNFSSILLPEKTVVDFDDLKKITKILLSAEQNLDELDNLRIALSHDYEKRKKNVDALEKEYLLKKEQQQHFSQDNNETDEALAFLSRKQHGEVIDEQLQQAEYKKKYAQIKVEENRSQLDLLEPRILIKKMQVDALKKQYAAIKRVIIIDKQYVKKAEEKLERSRQEFFDKREKFNDQIRILLPLKEQFKKNFERVVKRFDISSPEVMALKDWSKEPEMLKTESDWLSAGILGAIHAHENLVDTNIELLEGQARQAHIDFHHQELEFEILKSWYRMTHRHAHFNVDDEIAQEIKKYENNRSQLKIDLIELFEKRDNAIHLLYKLNVIRDKIKNFLSILEKQQTLLFAHSPKEFREAFDGFVKSDDEVRKRINFIGKLMETYSKSIVRIEEDIKEIGDVMVELGAKGFWIRSEQSIEWSDLDRFFPDIQRFLRDVKATGISYVKNFSIQAVVNKIVKGLSEPYVLLLLLLRILILFIVYLLLRLYIPDIYNYLIHRETRYYFTTLFGAFLAALLGFFYQHFTHFYIWCLCFFAVSFDLVDHYLAIWFYLFSILYLLLLFYGFLNYVLLANKSRGYIFISQNYLWRFTAVMTTLVSGTIIILFFRKAFLVGNYFDSPTPDILLAINFILFQIALMFLIGKEQILSFISVVKTPFAEWIEEHVEKYYYVVFLCLMTIIIMSNPYVGYWRQVFYVVSRVILTACLIPLFSWLHNSIKRSSSDFFFYYTDGSSVKERFAAGKTWYGLFIIVWFVIFIVLGIVVGARIWDVHISLFDIRQWFGYTIYNPGIDEITGKPIHVTGLSILKICMYVIGGFILAYIINRFVLARIFDPLLVGSGIQSTILTITRYVSVVAALLLGLQSAGLEGMAMKLVVLVGIMSFAVKEPLADFFAYFIILVQRPVKIGDFIQIENDETMRGVVRHITPRSTIVRNRNSVTLVIPNSMIITKAVKNWNYVRTFSSIDDIDLTIAFNSDVDVFKQIILEIFDANHNILKNPTPIVWLINITDIGYCFRLRGFLSVEKVIDRFEIESQLRMEIVRRLRKAGIQFALKVRVVTSPQEVYKEEEQKIS